MKSCACACLSHSQPTGWQPVPLQHTGRLPVPQRRGLSLMEALAALLLAVIVLPVAMGTLSRTLEAASGARKQAVALRLAEAQMALLLHEDADQTGQAGLRNLDGSQTEGGDFDPDVFGPDAANFHWESLREVWNEDVPGVERLVVRVSWLDRGHRQSLPVETLVTFTPDLLTGGTP